MRIACLKALSWYSPAGTEEIYENPVFRPGF